MLIARSQRARRCSAGVLSVAAAMLACWSIHGSAAGQRGGAASPESVAGTIDIHAHSSPDDRARSIDAIDLAKLARDRGMRAIVLKNHHDPTGAVAYLVRKEVPGVEVFGGIALNLTVGGINPVAVEHMTQLTGGWGRVVWMPTFDAENHVRGAGQNRPFVSVARNGELLPATKDVIALVAKHNLILATGHSSPEEGLMLVREGRRQGVRHMVITHAITAPVRMTVAQMKEAAQQGAYIEFVYGSLLGAQPAFTAGQYADAIRGVGPAFCIMSSDLGQADNPLHPDGFAAFIAAMRAQGFTEGDINRMTKENPARLLGLTEQSPEAIESGGRTFQAGCARCHGVNGDQVPGVALAAGRFRRATSDQELARLIIEGIPLTGMPASNLSEQDAGNVVAYLRSLAAGADAAAIASLPGDLEQGRTLVEAKGQCLTCHSLGVRGARAGPDLGSVGLRPPDELRRSILDPEAEIKPENRSVRVVTRQGTTVTGRLLNHDFFTAQLIDSMDRLRSFTKSELREFTILKTSPMPSYRDRLSADEVTDIVKYLSSLRGRP